MYNKKILSHFGFTLDSQGILFKTVDEHNKMYKTLNSTQNAAKYIFYKSHLGL